MKRRLVLVEWIDSHSGHAWRPMDDIADAVHPLHCRSVGWIVAKKNGTLVLAASISGEKNGDIRECGTCDIAIPTSAIQRTVTLREVTREVRREAARGRGPGAPARSR